VVNLQTYFYNMQLKPTFSNSIQHIIFDFGAVIININYHLTSQAFQNLGVSNFDELFSKAKQSNLFNDLEKGLVAENDFYNTIRTITQLDISNKNIETAWNAMLLDLPIERINLIHQLKNKYNTFLLSNTNKIHADAFLKQIDAQMTLNYFNSAFNKIYLSHEINLRKPDAEIFEFVLSKNNLDTQHTLFIDDSIQHVESAKKLGIHTHHLLDSETIFDLFE
jgi:putative hydrolase of the HAD superfamily